MIIKYLKKISYYILLLNLIYSQNEIDLNLSVISSGKYSLSSFIDPNINLWQVDIINNYNGSESQDLRLEIDMKKDGVTVIWGVSKPILLNSGSYIPSKTNMNFVGTDLSAAGFDDDFYNEVQSTGILPAGEYELTIRSYLLGPWNDRNNHTYDLIDKQDKKVNASYIDEETRTLQNLNIDERVWLIYPEDMESIYDSNPWFRWESPGFGTPTQPIKVEYRVIIALFNPELHSSLEDALNDEINIYFDSGWDPNLTSLEVGSPEQISIQYPVYEKELSCGYQYCWRVEAREDIDGFESYNGGIWGWPDAAKSDVIYSFYYGSSLSENQISSPGSYINTVLPTFSFSSVLCADSYEVWLSDSNDPEFNNPIWKSEYFQSVNYQYPTSSSGLSPGEKYFWKIRVNPETTPGPWSNIFSFTVNDISFLSPANQETINTLFPVFNILSPSNIYSYQLLISDYNDVEVDEYNILSENLDFFPYEFPINNQTMLSPGRTYYWKVQTIDENGSYTTLINDNTTISSFRVKPVELTFPDNGSYNISLTPLFSWEAPIGTNGYEIEFTNVTDLNFDNIIFSANTSSPFFLSSNLSSSLPFENGTTYLWRIKTVNNNGQGGSLSEYFSFSTILDNSDSNTLSTESTSYEQLGFEVSLSGIDGKNIDITIINGLENADTYFIQLSDNSSMDNIIASVNLSADLQTYSFSKDYNDEDFEWAEDYYIQILAYLNNELIGESSNIEMVIMPSEPGSEQQVSFNIELNYTIVPSLVVDIIDPVENATNYILRLSENSDMSNFIFSELINTSTQYTYENSNEELMFGKTYYAQLIPLKEDKLHGNSSFASIFIPNITIPKPSDTPFYFDYSNPQATSYLVEISTTEDFAIIFHSDITETNNIEIPEDTFATGTPYYWRVRGLDNNGTVFGLYSNSQYFISSGETITIDDTNQSDATVLLEIPSNGLTISTKYPTFSWSNYNDAEKYEIIVSTDLELNNVVWNSQNIFSNNTTYPSTGAETLNYNTIYYWTVRPIRDNIALAGFSDPLSFTVSSNFIPETNTPKGISDALKPYFSWTKIQNSTKYGLIISANDDYSSIIYNNQNINDNIFQYPDDAPNLLYSTDYFWKVVAFSSDDSPLGDYSSSTTFTTPSGLIKIEFIFGKND